VALGAISRLAGRPAIRQVLPARDMGPQRDPSTDRAQCLAAAVRAGVARSQEQPVATRCSERRRRNDKSLRHAGGFCLALEGYLAFSRISTSRQRLVADSGRVSISETRSPTPAMPFSSCAFTLVVVRMILP